MSTRRSARGRKVIVEAGVDSPVGFVRTDRAVVCSVCGASLPVYAGRELTRIHRAMHATVRAVR